MKQAKVWGVTQTVWKGANAEVHRISVNKGGYCSIHKHNHKYNMFYVEMGLLQIDRWDNNTEINSTILGKNESTIVEPGLYHKFKALENTIAYEIYWVELTEDIIRKKWGGSDEKNKNNFAR